MDIDTDDLEDRLFEACHNWTNGKPTNTALFGPVAVEPGGVDRAAQIQRHR
jgi:hypothetical protein